MTPKIKCVHHHKLANAKRHELIARLVQNYEICRPDETKRSCGLILLGRDKFDQWLDSPTGVFHTLATRSEYHNFIMSLVRNEGITCMCSKHPIQQLPYMASLIIH